MAVTGEDLRAEVTAEAPHPRTIYHFGEYLLHAGGLFRRAEAGVEAPVPVGSRALEILTILVRRAGELVPRQAIMEAVWPRTAVEESNLAVQIAALRRVLDAGRPGASCIKTITSRGYRFVSPVTVQAIRDPPVQPGLSAKATPPTQRLSIIVLPFRWQGDDPSGASKADALTDALTIELGKLPGATTIAYEIARSYQAGPVNLRAIRENLQVRYAVEGSIGCTADEERVSARLVDTESGVQLWADRFVASQVNFAADHEALLRRLSSTLGAALIRAESSRSQRERPRNPDAFDLVIRAQAINDEPSSPQRLADVKALLKQAMMLDPGCLAAITGLAWATLALYADRGSYWLDADEPERLAELIAAAQTVAPADASVLTITAMWLEYQGHYEAAIAVSQRLIDAYPGNPHGYARLGRCKTFCGEAVEAIPLLEKAIQLSPQQPYLHDRYWRLGFAYLLSGREREALPWFRRSIGACPDAPEEMQGRRYRLLAASYALTGEVKRARDLLSEFGCASSLVTLRCLGYENHRSAAYAEQYAHYRHGLRLAGLRDHAEEDTDFGVVANDELHAPIAGLTPRTASGATTIGTAALAELLDRHSPIVIDTLGHFWGTSIPGAIGLPNSGVGGRLTDSMQNRLRKMMQQLTGGDAAAPIVAIGFNSERFDGRNLALRLVALGYTNVYWYRGGREAWMAAGMPAAEVALQHW